jgi:ribonuclease HII
MEKLAQSPKYKKYGWEKNKGYGTKSHIFAIKRYGLTRMHRKLFVRSIFKDIDICSRS